MTGLPLPEVPFEAWQVSKPATNSHKGIIAAQEFEAALVGAAVMEDGGNAIDGVVAAALALTVTEPWMSGLGGGGYMVAYIAAEQRVRVIDFGMVAPAGLDPADYPLTGATGADMFGWPEVAGDVNIHGPKSIAVPGAIAGYAMAAAQYGRKSWGDLVAPAAALARRGHRVSWWTTLNVASEADILRRYPTTSAVWLPGHMPPVGSAGTDTVYLDMGALARTLDILAEQGPEAFYEGELAQAIARDVRSFGGSLSEDDLGAYAARTVEPLTRERANAVYHVPGGLTAGPTFVDAVDHLSEDIWLHSSQAALPAYAEALIGAYRRRLERMGHAGDLGDRSCTTHISGVDIEGNLVMMTTTLLSRFGSRVVLPETGLLMNNGINWFDPRPGRPNSIAPGRRPLSNMCPMIATRDGKPWFGFGASGGRKIMPAVFQMASFINDFNHKLIHALAMPRIDVSGIDRIVYDGRLDPEIVRALGGIAPVQRWDPIVMPSNYATPSGINIVDNSRALIAASHIHSPAAAAVSIEDVVRDGGRLRYVRHKLSDQDYIYWTDRPAGVGYTG